MCQPVQEVGWREKDKALSIHHCPPISGTNGFFFQLQGRAMCSHPDTEHVFVKPLYCHFSHKLVLIEAA